MPLNKMGSRIVALPLWRADYFVMEVQEPLFKSGGSMGDLRDLEFHIFGDGKGTPVKQLVVQGAQGNAVIFQIRSSCLVPLDVGSFKGHKGVSDAYIEPAHSALEFICPEDSMSE
jgi:hypothetical protein